MTTLLRHGEPLGVARLGPGTDLPDWATSGTLLSVTATAAETSVVCGHAGIPHKARPQGPFTAYEVEGPLDFALTGLLSSLLLPLAEAAVSVFTISTYDTDWILVPAAEQESAEQAWRGAGHTVQTSLPAQTGKQP